MRITNLGRGRKRVHVCLSRLLKVTGYNISHPPIPTLPPHISTPTSIPTPHTHTTQPTHPHTTHPHHTPTLHTPHHTHSTDDINEAIAQVNSTSQDFYFQTEATRMTSNNASSKLVRACERGGVGGLCPWVGVCDWCV